MKRLRLLAGLVALPMTSACTTQTAYLTGQNWQLEQCRKLGDIAERQRCEKSNAMSYEQYRSEAAAAQGEPRR